MGKPINCNGFMMSIIPDLVCIYPLVKWTFQSQYYLSEGKFEYVFFAVLLEEEYTFFILQFLKEEKEDLFLLIQINFIIKLTNE